MTMADMKEETAEELFEKAKKEAGISLWASYMHLKGKCEDLEEISKQRFDLVLEKQKLIESQSEEIKELKAALEFYSVNKNYENQPMGSQWSMDGGMVYSLSEIMQDKGKRAQAALRRE